jgi:predicted RNA-binding Zn-ribbon protein involved in translation (DUF1610 family)
MKMKSMFKGKCLCGAPIEGELKEGVNHIRCGKCKVVLKMTIDDITEDCPYCGTQLKMKANEKPTPMYCPNCSFEKVID